VSKKPFGTPYSKFGYRTTPESEKIKPHQSAFIHGRHSAKVRLMSKKAKISLAPIKGAKDGKG